MKSITILSILGGVVLVLSVVVTANNVTWGAIRPYNRLLATDRIVMKSGFLRKQTTKVSYPPKGHISNTILSAIKVTDLGGSKDFGNAALIEGGPGHRNSTISLKSQKSKPLNFTIEYYG